jgi:hypothetical protein
VVQRRNENLDVSMNVRCINWPRRLVYVGLARRAPNVGEPFLQSFLLRLQISSCENELS